uniref:ANK_REP_REGION domain-containing protein n=1 Tax=Steinernema glaseri TaxID=37863 RepID=A0A1I7ZB98_9BILA
MVVTRFYYVFVRAAMINRSLVMTSTPPSSSAPLYAVFVPKAIGSPAGEVFKSLREASTYATSPLPKQYGARFKRFTLQEEANVYARCGSGDPTSSETSVSGEQVVASEPSAPYPTASRPQLNEVKRAIESNNNELFRKLAEQNPRVLINTQADTPTVIAEGCRYNALHLAAKVGNLFVTKYVLDLVQDHDRLAKVYDTQDVAFRSEALLENFLTTPDRGENSTPLHFASKFGHADLVAILASFSVCNLTTRNKYAMSPADVVCERFSGESRTQRSATIRRLLGAFYVGLYRSVDCGGEPTLAEPTYRYPPHFWNPSSSGTQTPIKSNSRRSIRNPDSAARVTALFSKLSISSTPSADCLKTHKLSAVAGPFESEDSANDFFKKWNSNGKDVKLCDAVSGYEKVGRGLAKANDVLFSEYSTTFGMLVITFDPAEEKFFDAEDGEIETTDGKQEPIAAM